MQDHSLIAAGLRTYAKIALLAITAASVFLAVINASGSGPASTRGSVHGPIVKATGSVIVTKAESPPIR
jgi:hypothetical protein